MTSYTLELNSYPSKIKNISTSYYNHSVSRSVNYSKIRAMWSEVRDAAAGEVNAMTDDGASASSSSSALALGGRGQCTGEFTCLTST